MERNFYSPSGRSWGKANPILRILLDKESLSESLEGRKTSIIRESGVKEESKEGGWKRADFPASGSDSRFTAFVKGREGTGKREGGGGGGCKKGGSVSARILISSPRPMVP